MGARRRTALMSTILRGRRRTRVRDPARRAAHQHGAVRGHAHQGPQARSDLPRRLRTVGPSTPNPGMARRRSTMTKQWTRRQVLAQAGIAAAMVYTLDPHELCCGVNAYAQTAAGEKFELKKVGDGIWAAVAEVRYKVNSNAAVIETNDGLVIVDTHSKPSAARALYKEIQAVSKKPVRKIVNTHFHWDHWQGNEVYASANPGLEIITTEQTKQNLTKPDAGVGGVPFIEKQLGALPGEIAKLKEDIGKAPNAETKARLESNLTQAEAYQAELKQIKPALPTRTVSKTVTLQEGGREI